MSKQNDEKYLNYKAQGFFKLHYGDTYRFYLLGQKYRPTMVLKF